MKVYKIGDTREKNEQFYPGWHRVEGDQWILTRSMIIPVIEVLERGKESYSKPDWVTKKLLVDKAAEIPPPPPDPPDPPSLLAILWRRIFGPRLPKAKALPKRVQAC